MHSKTGHVGQTYIYFSWFIHASRHISYMTLPRNQILNSSPLPILNPSQYMGTGNPSLGILCSTERMEWIIIWQIRRYSREKQQKKKTIPCFPSSNSPNTAIYDKKYPISIKQTFEKGKHKNIMKHCEIHAKDPKFSPSKEAMPIMVMFALCKFMQVYINSIM